MSFWQRNQFRRRAKFDRSSRGEVELEFGDAFGDDAAQASCQSVEAEPLLAAADKVAAMRTGRVRKHSGTP